jgi:hypothetical protein
VPPPQQKQYNLALSFPEPRARNNEIELIISTTGGDVLVDTIGSSLAPIRVSFKSSESRFDVAYIYYYARSVKYVITLFRAVDPTDWDTVYISSRSAGWYYGKFAPEQRSTAEITYFNAPASQPQFTNDIHESTNPVYSGSDPLLVNYKRKNDLPALLFYPDLGLYDLRYTKSDNDTINLSEMKKARRVPFGFPDGFITSRPDITGVLNTNDLSKALKIGNNPSKPLEVVYPGEFSKYEYIAYGTDLVSKIQFLYSWGDSVPTGRDFLKDEDFKVNSLDPDNFSISFPGKRPFMYSTHWTSNIISFVINSDVDSVTAKPLTRLAALKSKLIGTTSIVGIKLWTLAMERSPGQTYDKYLRRFTVSDIRNRPTDIVVTQLSKTYF